MPDGKVLVEVEATVPGDSSGLRSAADSIAPAFRRRRRNCRILPQRGNLPPFPWVRWILGQLFHPAGVDKAGTRARIPCYPTFASNAIEFQRQPSDHVGRAVSWPYVSKAAV